MRTLVISLVVVFNVVKFIFADNVNVNQNSEIIDKNIAFSSGTLIPICPEYFKYWKPGFLLAFSELSSKKSWLNTGIMLQIGYQLFNYEKFWKKNEQSNNVNLSVEPLFFVRTELTSQFFIPSFKIPYIKAGLGLCGFFGGQATISSSTSSIAIQTNKIDDEGVVGSVGFGLESRLQKVKFYIESEYINFLGFNEYLNFVVFHAGLGIPISFSFFDSF